VEKEVAVDCSTCGLLPSPEAPELFFSVSAPSIVLSEKIMARKEPDFAERLQTAAKAKQARLEKMRATGTASGAPSAERHAALMETAKAREIRIAERDAAKRAAAEQREAERAAEKARQERAVAEEKARKEAERIAQAAAEAALKNEQKAARDAKYAARKARQK
jgi:hypothetical protein